MVDWVQKTIAEDPMLAKVFLDLYLQDGVKPPVWLEDFAKERKQADLGKAEKRGFQAVLNELGFNSGRPDGVIGTKSIAAIKAFQKTYGLEETGELDTTTQFMLDYAEETGGKAVAVRIGRQQDPRKETTPGVVEPQRGSWEKTNDIASRLMRDLMKDFGLTRTQASAFVGNLAHESGNFKQLQEIKPLVKGSKGGWGFAQWTGARRKAFEAWADEMGLDPRSYEANYGYLKRELSAKDPIIMNMGVNTIKNLQKTTTLGQATKLVMDSFLRPSAEHAGLDSRISYAKQFSGKNIDEEVFTPNQETFSVSDKNLSGAPLTSPRPRQRPIVPGEGGGEGVGGLTVMKSSKTLGRTSLPDPKNLGMIGGVKDAASGTVWQGFGSSGMAHDPTYKDYSQLFREYTTTKKAGYVAVGKTQDGQAVYAAPDYAKDKQGNYLMVNKVDAVNMARQMGSLIPEREWVKSLYGQAKLIPMQIQSIYKTPGSTGDSVLYTQKVNEVMKKLGYTGGLVAHGKEFFWLK